MEQLEEERHRLKHKKIVITAVFHRARMEIALNEQLVYVNQKKKHGRQSGRKGKTLEMVNNPDHIIEIIPECLTSAKSELFKG